MGRYINLFVVVLQIFVKVVFKDAASCEDYTCVISGPRRGENEICVLFGFYAANW
jgi:hypothetical protein